MKPVLALALAILGLAAVVLPLPANAQAAAAEQRLALVIGNAAYPKQALKNPANDAKAVASSLRRLGFQVIERIDTAKKPMEDAILEFGEKLKQGGVGLFYYAGHGVQVRGHNYLVPIDAALPSEASVRVQAVDVDLILEQMSEARNRANVVILDACRNNPFLEQRRGSGKGLAAIDAARGTLIAYSTAPGNVAVDGDGANSPYTANLVRSIQEPGLAVEDLFKRVRAAVIDQTQGAQTPWESSSLTGDLVLNINITVNPPAAASPGAAAAPATAANKDAAEIAFWESMGRSTNPADYEDYLRQFPTGIYSGLAKRRIADLKKPVVAAPPPKPAPAPAPPPSPQAAPAQPAAAPPPSPYATQTAAAPTAVVDPQALRQRSYERLITILLGQTVGTGTDQGKRNDYRGAPRPKAIAACIDWSGSRPEDLRIGAWASSWIPPGAIGTPPRQDALEKCTRGNNTPERCLCQVIDENDANVVDVPADFARRAARQ